LDGLCLAAAAFTNLTRDHLDYHRDIASYRLAKLRLFENILVAGAPALTMADLEPTTLAALRDIARRRKLALGTVGLGGDIIRLISVSAVPEGQALVLEVDGALRHIVLPLAGRFQIDNALLAAGLAREVGIANSVDHLADLVPVRGRLERAAILDHGATVYVDYAHTPDALARLLAALRPHARGRLIVVFGAGGDRDPGKRPLMGAIARRDADLAIITDDNPRDEDPASIRAGIIASCPGGVEIADRRQAIAAGLAMLRQGDVLVVAGKGHEQGQIIGDAVVPFDDVAVIRELVG
jgi:UDP-N-acetylmuramoyl-L-alanyl-D-glutamate--2,6-diaminopimelate ligase